MIQRYHNEPVGLRVTPEAKEGLAAFLDKRPAAWIARG